MNKTNNKKMKHEILLEQFYKNKDNFSNKFNIRIHRSISWIKKAELTDDEDIRFITLWISFNSSYARKISKGLIKSTKSEFRIFLKDVCSLDLENKIYSLIWNKYSNYIRLLLDNYYVFQAFWAEQHGEKQDISWEQQFHNSKKSVHFALANKDTDKVLWFVFDRLYTLRNQLIHGGATYNSSYNRTLLHNSNEILLNLLPIIIEIMIFNYDKMDWGIPFYPPLENFKK